MPAGLIVVHRTLALVAIVAIWFVLLGYRDLIDPDEGRYAEIPREMVASGDWLTPRLQGMKYFEKPPLQYWTTAIAYLAFGESAAVARLSTALFGLAGALWIAWIGRRLFGPDAGDLALLIGASSLLYFVMGHVLTLDMALTFFLTLGMGSLAMAQVSRAQPTVLRNWMLLAWAALAGAVLTKGLVGVVLPAAAVAVYMIWQRDWVLLRHLHLGKGLLLLTALCAPWFVAVSLANHDFARFFFVHEHFQRFTTTVHGRQGPGYYFVGIFLLGTVPWVVLSVTALIKPGFSWRGVTGAFEPQRLFWVYIGVVLVFFSISDSKLPPYVLPVWPFVALLAGHHARGLQRWRADGWIAIAMALIIGLMTLALPRFATASTPLELLQTARPWIFASAAWMLVVGCVLLLWRGSLKSAFCLAALCAMMSLQMLLWGTQTIAPSRSGHDIAQRIKDLGLPDDTPVYLVGAYSPSLAFYLRRTIDVVDYMGELRFGIEAEPKRIVSSLEGFASHWRTLGQAVAVFAKRRWTRYRDLELPMQVIATGPRYTLVVKQPVAQTAGLSARREDAP